MDIYYTLWAITQHLLIFLLKLFQLFHLMTLTLLHHNPQQFLKALLSIFFVTIRHSRLILPQPYNQPFLQGAPAPFFGEYLGNRDPGAR